MTGDQGQTLSGEEDIAGKTYINMMGTQSSGQTQETLVAVQR